MKTAIEQAIKAVKKSKDACERSFRNIAEMRERLPQAQQELDDLKNVADIKNNDHLARLSRLHSEIEIITNILQSDPASLIDDSQKLSDSIDSLNRMLLAEALGERENLILAAIKVLIPFTGSEAKKWPSEESFNPAREVAETLPILDQIPVSLCDSRFASTITHSPTAEGVARTLTSSAEKAVVLAETWVKNGGKFANYLT